MLKAFCNIVLSMLNIGGCNHENYSSPRTPLGSNPLGYPNEVCHPEQACHITCLDCGASATYNPYEFKRNGPWVKVVAQTNRSEIIPHVYCTR